ncbi:MAG: hypothetical protein D8M57_19585 [Candidatus Scalindua sp. AMX11]|nr:MAG: hypothetical protein DWQ00_04450 [Candidatus Scalindua sp.]NOG83655.1 WbqC family protein [Planctomycetota bacterium]RZV69968.1 MAG: hypothetical protein EX341_15770 [Candidatus Scalindua sp. SCAELEC01]TDE63196.1 MAG: hypothetical protein D8M57_19585 [Candidatus Scalindua sp. AMX11]GJQ60097.1 MAG: hypothetical protein SCALA701_28980 [Candidatus Scalindua sp.]
MILASHQPYFFPYLGYFSLISAVEKFVFFDTSQFKRQSWMTRNRILKPNRNEFQYIKIGLQRSPFQAMLPECKLTTNDQWKVKLLAQLEHYKKKAAYYEETMSFLKEILNIDEDTLVGFNVSSTIAIAHRLKLSTPFFQHTAIEHRVEKASEGGLWGMVFSEEFGADTYINAPDGEKLYPTEVYKKAGIKIGFIQHKLYPYFQNNESFIPGLSIIDVLMFNGVEKTSEMVHDYTIKWVNN